MGILRVSVPFIHPDDDFKRLGEHIHDARRHVMATTDRVQDRPENYRQPPKDAWSLNHSEEKTAITSSRTNKREGQVTTIQ